ncbi:MAG: NAD-dependent epimerase/dehydratase family protein [Acidobacteria bacterium]|nr:NAD-dependent epimerase/dehydratase family protein [Acidobacteriota bacterium]
MEDVVKYPDKNFSRDKNLGNPLASDLGHVLAHTTGLWEELRGQRIFITGGTGFFGCWLLESFAWANDRLELDASALVLTRNPDAFRQRVPHLASHRAVEFLTGDVRTFDFPPGNFSHLIHAATESSARLNEEDPLLMFDTIVQGTRRTLEFARRCGVKKFLLTSSGAVYGKQPSKLTHIPEDYQGAPDPAASLSAYGEGKRASELLCALYAKQYGVETKIARCFAFVGPYLPLHIHFAIGNFIYDALLEGPIRVNSDGTPYRSYLYAADLVIWLWAILFTGQTNRPYNVGSERDVSIADLARAVRKALNCMSEIRVARQPKEGKLAERYVPSTRRAQAELGLNQTVDLADAIMRTAAWYRGARKVPIGVKCANYIGP